MKKLNCWEFNKCGRAFDGTRSGVRKACPASVEAILDGVHGGSRAGRACWTVAGTMCKGKPMGIYAEKINSCTSCSFYKMVKKDEGASFMNASVMLRHAESGIPVMRVAGHLSRDDQGSLDTEEMEGVFSATLITSLKRAYDECGYCESRFAHMVKDLGARKAVKRVLNRQQFLYGLSELSKSRCLEYSLERLVLDYRFAGLFNESERLTALSRLKSCDDNGLGKMLLGNPGKDCATC